MNRLSRLAPQPLIAVALGAAALLIVVPAWADLLTGRRDIPSGQQFLMAAALAAAYVLSGLFPVHLRSHTKLEITTPQLFLMAFLLPAPLAVLAVALATLLTSVLTARERGNTRSDMATFICRWVLVVWLGASVAGQPVLQAAGLAAILAATAAVMLAGDVLSAALEISPMSGEPPVHVIVSIVRDAVPFEVLQYLLGFLGAIVALSQTWALVLMALPLAALYLVLKRAKEMQHSTQQILNNIADTVDLRDPYTGGHSRRVAASCARLLAELNIHGAEADLIVSAARVHDIGKIAVPDAILLKPGRLTPEETRIMQGHPGHGADLLVKYKDFARGVEIVRHHHEHWSGAGYPSGLKTYNIPFGSRIIAVADTLDALTTDRPYRKGMTPKQALQVLQAGAGTQWDAQVVEALLRLMRPAESAAAARAFAPGISAEHSAAVAA